MKKSIFALILAFSVFASYGLTDRDIEKLQEKCGRESRSLLKDRNGTPSCDQLRRIHTIRIR